MKIGKTGIIVGIVIIAGIIMYYVWNQSKTTNKVAAQGSTLSADMQALIDRVPFETRKKIVDVYNWQVTFGDKLILRDGIVFNTTKNQPDGSSRTSVERYRLDGVLWEMRTNYKLIDEQTEYFLGKYTLAQFITSLSY